MNRTPLEGAALAYLRFKKRCPYVTTELEVYHTLNRADVIGIDKNDFVYEIEIKRSISDFKNDLKKYKHQKDMLDKGDVNTLYYLVPEDLEEKAKELLKNEFDPRCGLIVCRGGISIRVSKKAKKLHNNKASDAFKSKMIHRMSSEIANFWLATQWNSVGREIINDTLNSYLTTKKS